MILLIDRSASMGAAGGASSPFAKARHAAGELLKELPAGQRPRTLLISTRTA